MRHLQGLVKYTEYVIIRFPDWPKNGTTAFSYRIHPLAAGTVESVVIFFRSGICSHFFFRVLAFITVK